MTIFRRVQRTCILPHMHSRHVTCPVCNKTVPAHIINEHLDKGCSSVSPSSSRQTTLSEPTPAETASKKQAKHTSTLAPIFTSKVKTSSTQSLDPSPGEAASPVPSQAKRSSEVNLAVPAPKKRKVVVSHAHVPLAEMLRPKQLSQFIGQSHLMQEGSLLSTMLRTNASWSLIFWGPPGCGKTTLAKLIAQESDAAYKELSATASGVNEVKAVVEESKKMLSLLGKRTILFLDEIHRFNKAQQDVLLPFVEQGLLQLIGATTENPSFRIIGALLSRCRVLRLEPLSDQQMTELLSQSLQRVDQINCQQLQLNESPNYAMLPPSITSRIVSMAGGDARVALSLLEIALKSPNDAPEAQIMESLKQSLLTSYDRTGEDHYDMISALHKSVRGSNGSAAMYWLARMLTAGEDPLFIARRMVVCASEDIGLADSHALPLAMATIQACQVIGMPECRINLAHLVAYLSEAPKSTRAYEAYKRAEEAAKATLNSPVPLQIRNAPTALMEEMGYGKNYHYNPDFRHPVHNQYLPQELMGSEFLYKEGDTRGKMWDEEALCEWEKEENGRERWAGRDA